VATTEPDPAPVGRTRHRLLEAGLRLFAARGFSAVRVGDIEQAAGLVPRRGALYRHFDSKAALLSAAVEAHLASVAAANIRYTGDADARTADAPATPEQVGEFILAEMDRQRLITQILERDGARLVPLRDRFRVEVSDTAYRTMTKILRHWLQSAGSQTVDDRRAEALAVHLVGALVNARRSSWTLGASPLGLDDDELLAGWASLCRALAESLSPG